MRTRQRGCGTCHRTSGPARISCGSPNSSGHRLDDTGTPVPLAAAELKALWDDLHAKYPADFTVSPQAVRAWRERQILDAWQAGRPDAAAFHKWGLVVELARGVAR